MYAVVRLNKVNVGLERELQQQLHHFERTHAAQPGYRGSLSVDLDMDRRLIVNLWQDQAHSDAARTALGPTVGRLLGPMLVQPSKIIGVGPVLALDLPPNC